MKHLIFKSSRITAILLVLFGIVVFTSCKKDDDPPTVTVEDGIYVKGAATAYGDDFNTKALMNSTRNEVGQVDRAALLEVFIALEGGGTFNIVKVAGADRTTYGPGNDWAQAQGGTNDEPNVTFQRGPIAESVATFTVASDGLYHVIFDTEVNRGAIVPVTHWGLIGAATPGGWGSDTELPHSGFNQSSMTFSATDVAMTLADYKFRYSSGWKVEIDTTYDPGGGADVGIKVNTNFGGAVAALVPGGDNINNTISGFYTATMVWTAGSGFTATMVKTSDLPLSDFSSNSLGLIGDGLVVGGNPHDWNSGLGLHTPAVNGDVYTWTWSNQEVSVAGSFKIREGDDWNGLSFGFPQVTMAGTGAADFDTNGDGNFVPLVDASYDFVLEIDAGNGDAKTFTATKL